MIKLLNTLHISDIKNFENIFNGLAKVITIEEDRKRVLSELYNTQAYLASAKIEVDKAFLNRAPLLKIIGSPSTGTDHLDLDEIFRRKIKCFDISKEYNLLKTFSATAELTFALILNLSRKIIAANYDAKQGLWSREKFTGTQLLNKNLGIIGLGRLGKITAKIGLGFGMRVYAFDIDKKKKNEKRY